MTLEGYINNLWTQFYNIRYPFWPFKWKILRTDVQFELWNSYMEKYFKARDRREAIVKEIEKLKSGDYKEALEKIALMNDNEEKKKKEREITKLKDEIYENEINLAELKAKLNKLSGVAKSG